jgi:hypothetical protein
VNTLGKDVTRRFFADGEAAYAALLQRWRELVQDPERRKALGPEHYLLYALLRGRDWRRAFCVRDAEGSWRLNMTSPVKRANGNIHGSGGARALSRLHSGYWEASLLEPFGSLLTPDALIRARSLVPPRGWRDIDAGEVGEAYDTAAAERLAA